MSDENLSPDEWGTLRGLLARAAVKIRRETQDDPPETRRNIDLSLANVEHFIACELAHATGQPCPVGPGRRQPS